METCPYDFLLDFDNWFLYHKHIYFDKWTHEQACQNIRFLNGGWVLYDESKYGMWILRRSKSEKSR